MIRLSIQARQALSRLTLPVLVVVSLGVMILGRADGDLAGRARMSLGNALAPIYGLLIGPESAIGQAADRLRDAGGLEAENMRLRAENERLRRWYNVAMALSAENTSLKRDLHWIPDPAPSYVTARVVADAGGLYARSLLLGLASSHDVRKGEIVLGADGLVGRITEVGPRSARVLLITDVTSRIPVLLETSHARAIMVGANGPMPHLLYVADGVHPIAGERVVTSAEDGVLPGGLPVGLVALQPGGSADVAPFSALDSLQTVRVFDYDLGGLPTPQASPVPPVPEAARRGGVAGLLGALAGRGARQAR